MNRLLKILAVAALAASTSACMIIAVEHGPDKPKPAPSQSL